MAMQRVSLAPELEISRVLTGLWQVADMEREGRSLDHAAAAAAMVPYLEAGCTTFDMADHYGSAEEIAGAFRREHAAGRPVELLTKWVPKPGPVRREEVREAVQRALGRLAVERLDLLQFHAWNYADLSYIDCLGWLQELREEGLIGALGLTNFDTAHLRVVVQSGIKIASNQVCFSLLDRRPLARMAEFCQQSGVNLLAYGTLAGGLLSERWLGKPEPSAADIDTWSLAKYKRFVDAAGGWEGLQALLQSLQQVAQRHDVSLANVAVRWVLDQPAVAGVIIGARLSQREHVADNLRLMEFALDAEDHAALEAALGGLQTLPGRLRR